MDSASTERQKELKTSDHQSEGRLRLTKDHEVTPKVKECRTMKDNEGQWRRWTSFEKQVCEDCWSGLGKSKDYLNLNAFEHNYYQSRGEREREIIKQCPNIEQKDPENIQIKCLETWCIRYISDKMWSVSKSSFFIQLIQLIPQSHLICLVGMSAWHHIVEQHLPGPAPRGQMDKWAIENTPYPISQYLTKLVGW